MHSSLPALVLLSTLFTVGCDTKAQSPVAPTSGAAAAPAPVAAKGLAAKDNDPKVIALVKAAIACPKRRDDYPIDTDCDGYKQLRASKEVPAALPTLFNLLDDDDPRVRFAAALSIPSDRFCAACDFQKDPVKAKRIVTALQNEKDKYTALRLADAASALRVEETGVLPALEAYVKAPQQNDAPDEILMHLLSNNSQSRPVFDFFLAETKSEDAKLRHSAVGAFWVGGGLDPEATCKMWEAHIDDTDASVASTATQCLGWSSDCEGHFDALLDRVEARAKAGNLKKGQGWGTGLEKMCESKAAKPKQKTRALKLAKTLAANKEVDDVTRSEFLNTVMSCDKGGKVFVSKFVKDEGFFVSSAAKDLTGKK